MNFKNVMGKDAGGGCGGHQQQQLQNLSALARQSSVYSLTFDEFQSTLGSMGKDFGSMNMDEFLKNIWTAEEGQVMAAAVATDSADLMGLQHQGSLTLPRTLSQKTVDEVWRDLLSAGQGPAAAADAPHQRRQPTLGEMTLEEFLVRAGVVREDMAPPQPEAAAAPSPRAISVAGAADDVLYGGNSCINLGFPQAAKGGGVVVNAPNANSTAANLAMTAAGTRPYSTPMPLGNSVDVGHPQGIRGGELVGVSNVRMNNGLVPGMVSLGAPAGVPVAMDSPANHLLSDGLGKNNGDLTSVSPVPYVFNGGPRGRKSGGTVEKVMERRQRRMIKNRESAARSRARKQAYTMELEAEVAKLKEQNEELMKKQAEMIEMQKNQVLEIINQQRRPKKQCLRRTQTDQVSRLSFLL